jgi:hypothetical protein
MPTWSIRCKGTDSREEKNYFKTTNCALNSSVSETFFGVFYDGITPNWKCSIDDLSFILIAVALPKIEGM